MRGTTLAALAALLLVSVAASPAAGTGDAFPDRIDLPDGFAPEGITTGHGTTVYVGSLAGGGIWRGDLLTGTGEVLVPGADGGVAVGVDYEEAHDRLWVAGGPTGTVRAYDGSSGALLATYEFPGSGFLNDLTVTGDAVYVTDSFVQRLAVVPLGVADTLPAASETTTLPLTGEIRHVADAFNANGIVAAEGGRSLILVQSVTRTLFTVDPDSGVTRAVTLAGDPLQARPDGLELRGHTLYVVQNVSHRISVLRLGPNLRTAKVETVLTNREGFDVPTTATLAAGRLWAVNARFGTSVTPDTKYWISEVPSR